MWHMPDDATDGVVEHCNHQSIAKPSYSHYVQLLGYY